MASTFGHFDFGDLVAAALAVVTVLLTAFYFVFTSRLMRKYRSIGQKIDVTSLRPKDVTFTDTELVVLLIDGSKIVTPLEWYPKLKNATEQQRNNFEILRMGIHWSDLNEDLSIAGMLRGRTQRPLN